MNSRHSPLASAAAPLLSWYDTSARTLPWRADPTPYHVWISEIMLQQTRVEAVRGYYERFLAVFPDIASLAAAPEEKLLKVWEGLGYYRRARNIQAAARVIMECHGGETLHPTQEVLDAPVHLRLLHHDFGDPRPVRRVVGPPRQRAAVLGEPAEQVFSEKRKALCIVHGKGGCMLEPGELL